MANAVKVEGLKEFRRDVKRADKEIDKELQKSLRETTGSVARQASADAPRLTGTMAGGYRGSARGARGVIRNPVFYSRMIEFGFHPRGSGTFVEGLNVIGRVLEREEERIVDEVDDAMDRAAKQMGWR